MGSVWLAQDHSLDRPVALKFVSDAVRLDPGALLALKRETRHSLRLTHPNIVRVYDWFEDSTHAAICLEYVDGSTLQLLKASRPGGCFDPGELLPIVEQLCDALAYAHEHARVVHRDLKPANLLLDREGRLKVVDFGIAISLAAGATRIQGADRTSGTVAFMSPQQLSGADAGASDDLYSLGATLYDLLTGRPPFLDGDVSYQVRELQPVSPSTRRQALAPMRPPLPPAWETTVLALLSKSPADRPSAARVRELLRDSATHPAPPPALPPSPAPQPRSARHGGWGRSSVLISAIGAAAWVTVVLATRNPPHRAAPAAPAAAERPVEKGAGPAGIVPPPPIAPLPAREATPSARPRRVELSVIMAVYQVSPIGARAAWLEQPVEFSGYVTALKGSEGAAPARLLIRADPPADGSAEDASPAWSVILPYEEAQPWRKGARVHVAGTIWNVGKDGVTVRDARIQAE